MKVIKPNKLTAASLTSTNAVETVAAWNAATNYTVGALALRTTTNRIYECLIAGVSAVTPEASELLAIQGWLDTGPTNKQAVLDEQVNTKSTATTSLVFTVATGPCNSIALFGITNAYAAQVTVRSSLGGAVVFTSTNTLDGTIINDWYEYFFELGVPKPDLILTGIPPFYSAHATVTLTGFSGDKVGCGVFVAGNEFDLGVTQYGASAGIIDYSKKETDEFGNTLFVRRAYSKRMSVKLELPNSKLNKIQFVLAELRATPCAWMGAPVAGFDPLTVYGFYRDFSIDVEYFDHSLCNIEIEGLI